MSHLALFVIRIVSGLLVAGHGSQKLFGWFEGPGLKNWSAATESMGMKPGSFFGPAGAIGEFGGGTLTALGFLNPIGPIAVVTMMILASIKAHWGKPIWASKGGAELALSFLAPTAAVALDGPGQYSLDSLLGVKLPRWVTALSLLGSAAAIVSATRPDLVERVLGNAPAQGTEQ
jgi:putative oxidoreductase